MTSEPMRWRDYFLRSGEECDAFWRVYLAERSREVLFILGHGFDSRMCMGIDRLLKLGGSGVRDVALVGFDEGESSPSQTYANERKTNGQVLERLIQGRGKIVNKVVQMTSSEGRRVGARNIATEFSSLDDIVAYTDVVVDISALPRGLYMPLVATLLAVIDGIPSGSARPNLHVLVSHSPDLDGRIVEEGLEDDASYLHGFAAAALENESTKDTPKIWMPVLGKRQRAQLE
ncbi:MAG: hypothetical protein KDA51_10190, partial [Planctomycetales bacterium]|nr:hypothetical protein [Planctomycetales bacterium]